MFFSFYNISHSDQSFLGGVGIHRLTQSGSEDSVCIFGLGFVDGGAGQAERMGSMLFLLLAESFVLRIHDLKGKGKRRFQEVVRFLLYKNVVYSVIGKYSCRGNPLP